MLACDLTLLPAPANILHCIWQVAGANFIPWRKGWSCLDGWAEGSMKPGGKLKTGAERGVERRK